MPSDGSYHTNEGGSRKRLKTNSQDTGRPAGNRSKSPEVVSLITPAKNVPAPVTTQQQEDEHASHVPCIHEQSLRTLHGDLDAMRQLITCKICERFLYEPYVLTCGHTFCYSCLDQWIGQNRKKTCPDCRTIIQQQPAPSYLIRDLVLVFVNNSELLPDGETSQEHLEYAKQEAELVAKDKASTDARTSGIFKGSFARGSRRAPLVAIRDHSDNVDRCPDCFHEVQDGFCDMCGSRVRTQDDDDLDWSDGYDYESDEELDQDLIDALAHDADFDHGLEDEASEDSADLYHRYQDDAHFRTAPRRGFAPFSDAEDSEDDNDDDDDVDDAEGEMDGFIDDGPLVRVQVEDSDTSGSDSEVTEIEAPRQRRGRQALVVLSDDEEEEDDEPILLNAHRSRNRLTNPRTRRPANTLLSDPSDSDDSDHATDIATHPAGHGFSPLHHDEESSVEGFYDDHRDYDNAGHEGHTFQYADSTRSGSTADTLEDDDDGEDISEGSDGQTHESLRSIQPTRSSRHRLGTLGPHSRRYIDRVPGSGRAGGGHQSLPDDVLPPLRPLQAHPFDLDNTLNSINRNAHRFNQHARRQNDGVRANA